MTSPTVTEITPRLQAVTPDPFIASLSRTSVAERARQGDAPIAPPDRRMRRADL
jgi:hypothetical protein